MFRPSSSCKFGDRLLTTDNNGRAEDWDAFSNKSLLVIANGAHVIVSYSGLAFIDSVPTDEWVAGLITRQDFATERPPLLHGNSLPFFFGRRMDITLGSIMQDIQAAVHRDYYNGNRTRIGSTGWTS